MLAAAFLAAALTSLGAGAAPVPPEVVGSIVQPYLKLQSALAGDDLAAARAGADAVLAALAAGPESDGLAGLRESAQSISGAEEISTARTAFSRLSENLISLVRTVGTGSDSPLYVAHCPMAFGGKGGDWIQADNTVANPYYGASMLRCGSIREPLKKGGKEPHPMHQPDMKSMPHAHGMMINPDKEDPFSPARLDAVHAGVPGYLARSCPASLQGPDAAGTSGGCQTACCSASD